MTTLLQRDLDISNYTVDAQTAAAAPPPPPPPPSTSSQGPGPTARKLIMERQKMAKEMEDIQKKKVVHKINQYMERFPTLSGRIPKLPQRCTLEEANEVLLIIRDEMNSQRSLMNLMKYTDHAFAVVENVWGDGSRMTRLPPPLRLNLSGLSDLWRRGIFHDEITPILAEIDIEYPWLGQQSLAIRCIEALSGVLLKVHLLNTNPQARKMLNLEKQLPLEEEEMSDLKNLSSKEEVHPLGNLPVENLGS